MGHKVNQCGGGTTSELLCNKPWRINMSSQLYSCIESHHRPNVGRYHR